MPSVAWKNLRNFGSLPVKLPVKKIFGKCFIGSKEPPSNSRWGYWGVIFTSEVILWPKISKNTLLPFKRQKETQLLNWYQPHKGIRVVVLEIDHYNRRHSFGLHCMHKYIDPTLNYSPQGICSSRHWFLLPHIGTQDSHIQCSLRDITVRKDILKYRSEIIAPR